MPAGSSSWAGSPGRDGGHPARRPDEKSSIIIVEHSGHVSYANCGLPYYVGGVIEDEYDLLLQTPDRPSDRFRLEMHVSTEAEHAQGGIPGRCRRAA